MAVWKDRLIVILKVASYVITAVISFLGGLQI